MKHHTQKVIEKLLPDLFLKTQNWAYPLSSSLKYYTVCFYRMPRSRLLKYIEFKVLTTCFNLAWVLFKKTKRGLKLVYLSQNLYSILKKYFTRYICLIEQFKLPVFLYLLSYWTISVLYLIVSKAYEVINFEINLSYLIKSFS